jgi:Protein of unknown function (DUF3768)
MYKPYDTHQFQPTKSELIRILNDAFRTEPLSVLSAVLGRTFVFTKGVGAHGDDFLVRALKAVQEYSTFTEDNDPHGEHDFGSFELDGVKLFWKIDYYDEDLESGSPDPADPDVTRRVLTILLAEEY